MTLPSKTRNPAFGVWVENYDESPNYYHNLAVYHAPHRTEYIFDYVTSCYSQGCEKKMYLIELEGKTNVVEGMEGICSLLKSRGLFERLDKEDQENLFFLRMLEGFRTG